jgi:hypothetical protein
VWHGLLKGVNDFSHFREPFALCHSEGAERLKNLQRKNHRFFAEFTLSGDSSTGSE